jgi:hypothetical protein
MDVIEDFDQDEPERIFFGDDQLKWFNEQLMKPADLVFVVSGGPNFEVDYGYNSLSEFPAEKRKLIQILRESGAEHVIFMAGNADSIGFVQRKFHPNASHVAFLACDFHR